LDSVLVVLLLRPPDEVRDDLVAAGEAGASGGPAFQVRRVLYHMHQVLRGRPYEDEGVQVPVPSTFSQRAAWWRQQRQRLQSALLRAVPHCPSRFVDGGTHDAAEFLRVLLEGARWLPVRLRSRAWVTNDLDSNLEQLVLQSPVRSPGAAGGGGLVPLHAPRVSSRGSEAVWSQPPGPLQYTCRHIHDDRVSYTKDGVLYRRKILLESLEGLPRYLFFDIARAGQATGSSPGGPGGPGGSHHVRKPRSPLKLRLEFTLGPDSAPVTYRLRGVVLHYPQRTHYTCLNCDDSGRWWEYDDVVAEGRLRPVYVADIPRVSRSLQCDSTLLYYVADAQA